jgi:hypothetical protein
LSCHSVNDKNTLVPNFVASRFFFDVPVYRLAEERYYAERERFVEGILYAENSRTADLALEYHLRDPGARAAAVADAQRAYGGCWRFNEVIGQIRLHFLGTQVRGEYFAVNRERIVRTRNRTLEFRTYNLAPEADIPFPITDASVLRAIESYLEMCRKELPGRFVDTELFFRIARHVKWADLFYEE